MIDENGRAYVPDCMDQRVYVGDSVLVGGDVHVVIDVLQVTREGHDYPGVRVSGGRVFCRGEYARVRRPAAYKVGDVVRVIATGKELLDLTLDRRFGLSLSIISHATYKVAAVSNIAVELALAESERRDARAWLPFRYVEYVEPVPQLRPRRLVPIEGQPGLFHVVDAKTGVPCITDAGAPGVVGCFGPSYPHVCPRCGAPAYVGLLHVDCVRRRTDMPECAPVRAPEPAIVEEVTLTNYPGKRTITTGAPAPGLEGAERIWRARDVSEYPGPESCLHPTREGAIAAWQARLAARKAAAK